jgi:hypothetical protein
LPFCAAPAYQSKLCCATFEREVMEKNHRIVISVPQVENAAQIREFEKGPGTIELPFIKGNDLIDEISALDHWRSVSGGE